MSADSILDLCVRSNLFYGIRIASLTSEQFLTYVLPRSSMKCLRTRPPHTEDAYAGYLNCVTQLATTVVLTVARTRCRNFRQAIFASSHFYVLYTPNFAVSELLFNILFH